MIQVKILDPRAVLPQQGSPMSAGYDLVACIDQPLILKYGDKAALIPTGLAMFIESPGTVGLIFPRSGSAHKKGLVLGNSVAVIDADYQGEWYISAWHRGNGGEWNVLHGGIYFPDITIEPGERIAQVVFVPVIHPSFGIVTEFTNLSQRG